MLITERTSDGRTVVRLHKDWHPGRISLGYIPPPKNYEQSQLEVVLQTQYLKAFKRRTK
jgi:hypothetical protein